MKQATFISTLAVFISLLLSVTNCAVVKKDRHRGRGSSSSYTRKSYERPSEWPVEAPEWRKAFRVEHHLFRKALVSDLEDVDLPSALADGAPWRDTTNAKFWEPIPVHILIEICLTLNC